MTDQSTPSSRWPTGRAKDAFKFWENASNPGHRHSEPWWIDFYAKELLLYYPQAGGQVLDLGCGTGTFYPHFKERSSSYVGVDFSQSMLNEFQRRWPQAEVICADVAALDVGAGPFVRDRFDFIFSNQVCQFFDRPKLHRHLEILASLAKPGGTCLIGNVPDRQLRNFYYAGGLRADSVTSWLRALKGLLVAALRGDGIGHWYTRRELAAAARSHGFECESFSSASFEYRFHLLLRKK